MTKILTRKANIRLSGYDYTQSNYYYITACTENKREWFGEIKNHEMVLNPYGRICRERLQNLQDYYKNIEIDTFVIMPNYIHGILIINKRAQASSAPTVSQIIRSFKSKSTMEYVKYLNQNNLNISGKIWQRSFYDYVIRSERSLNAIREYISHNPVNWKRDIDNLINL